MYARILMNHFSCPFPSDCPSVLTQLFETKQLKPQISSAFAQISSLGINYFVCISASYLWVNIAKPNICRQSQRITLKYRNYSLGHTFTLISRLFKSNFRMMTATLNSTAVGEKVIQIISFWLKICFLLSQRWGISVLAKVSRSVWQ